MAPALPEVTYVFHLASGQVERISLTFDPETFLLHPLDPAGSPSPWTRLTVHPCPQCPLLGTQTPWCPFARALDGFVHRFDAFYSYERSIVEVVTEQRTVVAQVSLQQAMASIVGLIGATSGCPTLAFFRPMARFHLPFASEEETLVRAFSLHLLENYLRAGGAGEQRVSVDDLEARYAEVATVNRGMAERVRSAFHKDALVNAIIILDTFAQAVPFVVQEALAELRVIFAPVERPSG
ncbi:DUF6901 family protein [Pararhodospirillum photometricum]|uniref:Uncharacterized protein n=1 Tax=Pararhodospirillum photometricum DSM 122 TaxID=1150469 RepID=H6SK44_PARPM|nr:hypothetical protein [Pararhodospirillum photometricum]CCG08359.1 Putative uncharacterized protein [Pararhodospirillum photometricum DSM 122]